MNTEPRHHSLDALRAAALLLGIALHATMSFLPGYRAVGWPIVDTSQSTALAWFYFVVHIFRMTLFFLIAGFFARLLHQKLGTGGFFRHRLRRIGLPLLVAMLVVMPLTILPLVAAVRLHPVEGASAASLLRPQGGIPWGHLWFLYLLLVLYALGIPLCKFVVKLDASGTLRRCADLSMEKMISWRILPLVLAVPLGLTFCLIPEWQAWDGIPSPVMGFIPNFPAVLAFGTAMLAGWMMHRQQILLTFLARDCAVYLTTAMATSLVAAVMVGPEAQLRVVHMEPVTKLLYATVYATAIWSWSFGLMGLATLFRTSESPRWRYLADASYWMYLMHIPLVWGLQVWMMDWPIPWFAKYPFILTVTFGVLLLLYRLVVRGTWVGVLLNGRRLQAP